MEHTTGPLPGEADAGGLERIAEAGGLALALASPEEIRAWSSGEVLTADTIDALTQRPVRDGLFCERIVPVQVVAFHAW